MTERQTAVMEMNVVQKAGVLVLGLPIYFGYPTGVYRAFLERLAFPVYSYHMEAQ